MNITAVNGRIFFMSDASLMASNGTRAGTHYLGWNGAPRSATALTGRLYFGGAKQSFYDGTVIQRGLYVSDGTPRGTRLVKAFASTPAHLTTMGRRIFFTASDGRHGVELWRSDGTRSGTVLVKNIRTGGPSRIDRLTRVGARLYFTANDGVHGTELWGSDGTKSGTVLVKNLRVGGSSSPRGLTAVGTRLYFTANDGVHGRELWRSDSIRAGTAMVKNIRPGAVGSVPAELTAVASRLYFTANDGEHGRELWRSDGTTASTGLVRDIRPHDSAGANAPGQLVNINGALVFAAQDVAHGRELWTTNGTYRGTVLAADINPRGSSSPSRPTLLNHRLIFNRERRPARPRTVRARLDRMTLLGLQRTDRLPHDRSSAPTPPMLVRDPAHRSAANPSVDCRRCRPRSARLVGPARLSRINAHSPYLTAVATPMVLIGAGPGLTFAAMTSVG